MKKFILIIIMNLFYLPAFCGDFPELLGLWNQGYDNVIKPELVELYYEEFLPPTHFGMEIFEFSSDNAYGIKFRDLEIWYVVNEINHVGSDYILECSNSKNDENLRITITFLEPDMIEVDGFSQIEELRHFKTLYRIESIPKVKKQRAVVNDDGVNLRRRPSIENGVPIRRLLKNYECVIVDKSESKDVIEGEEWYWYKINSLNCAEGWVYGKYLDIEETFLRDEKTLLVENTYFYGNGYFHSMNGTEIKYVAKKDFDENEFNEYLMDFLLLQNKMPSDKAILNHLNKFKPGVRFTKINTCGYVNSRNDYLYSLWTSVPNSSYLSVVGGNKHVAVFKNEGARLSRGLYIGMSKSEMLENLGTPDSDSEGVSKYAYNGGNGFQVLISFYYDENDVCNKITVLE